MPKKNRKQRQAQQENVTPAVTNPTFTGGPPRKDVPFNSLPENAWNRNGQVPRPSQKSWSRTVAPSSQAFVTTRAQGTYEEDDDWDTGASSYDTSGNQAPAPFWQCEPAPAPKENFWAKRQEFFQSALPQDENDEERMLRTALELSRLQSEEENMLRKLVEEESKEEKEDRGRAAHRPNSNSFIPSPTDYIPSSAYVQPTFQEPTSSYAQMARKASTPNTTTTPPASKAEPYLNTAESTLKETIRYCDIPGVNEFGEPSECIKAGMRKGTSHLNEDQLGFDAPRKHGLFAHGVGRGRTPWGMETRSKDISPGQTEGTQNNTSLGYTAATEPTLVDAGEDCDWVDSGSDCDDDEWLDANSLQNKIQNNKTKDANDVFSFTAAAPSDTKDEDADQHLEDALEQNGCQCENSGNDSPSLSGGSSTRETSTIQSTFGALNPQASIFQPTYQAPPLASPLSPLSFQNKMNGSTTLNVGEDGRIRRKYGPRRHKKSTSSNTSESESAPATATATSSGTYTAPSNRTGSNMLPEARVQNSGLPSFGNVDDTSEKLRQLCSNTLSSHKTKTERTNEGYKTHQQNGFSGEQVRGGNDAPEISSEGCDNIAKEYMPSSTSHAFHGAKRHPVVVSVNPDNQKQYQCEEREAESQEPMPGLERQFDGLQMTDLWFSYAPQYQSQGWNAASTTTSHNPANQYHPDGSNQQEISSNPKHSQVPEPRMEPEKAPANTEYNTVGNIPKDFGAYLGYSHPYVNPAMPMVMPVQSQMYPYTYPNMAMGTGGLPVAPNMQPTRADSSSPPDNPYVSAPFYQMMQYGMMQPQGTQPGILPGSMAAQPLGMMPGGYAPIQEQQLTNSRFASSSGTSGSGGSSPGESEHKPYVPYSYSQLAAPSFLETTDSFRSGFGPNTFSEKQQSSQQPNGGAVPPGVQMMPGMLPFMPMQLVPQQNIAPYGCNIGTKPSSQPYNNDGDIPY